MSGITAEKLYEYTLEVTGVVEYGASFQAVISGQSPPPPGGLRVDVAFAGPMTGRLSGSVVGVDYITVRADGRIDLDIKAEITTGDGEKIAFAASGVGMPQAGSPQALLRENVTLTTANPSYAWVNPLQIWGIGSVDFSTGKINISAYLPE
ncbi:MAG: DUF3237 family protein [Acidimicrobiales bacterium]|jgi:hypothetical protein